MEELDTHGRVTFLIGKKGCLRKAAAFFYLEKTALLRHEQLGYMYISHLR